MTIRRLTHTLILAAGCVSLVLLSACSSAPGAAASTRASGRSNYAFWPLFPDEPRVQFLRSLGGSADLAKAESSALENIVFGKEVEKDAMISKPYGLAMRDGRVYVCDMRAGSLVVFDLRKKQTRLLGTSGANRLGHPVAVAVADDGRIYVAESERGAIVVFDATERYSHSMGLPKFKPASLAVHGNRLYASDMLAQAVQVFDCATGKHVGTIGSVGDNDGQFRLPLGVATDKVGNVFVIDMMRGRLQKFSPDGQFLAGTGVIGDSAGAFARPKHIAVDSDGIIYVVDASFQNVQMFDDQLRMLMHFGAAGNFPGSMNLPAGICVDDATIALFRDELHEGFEGKRVIAVTNQFGDAKVSLYALGQKREGYAAADFARVATKVSQGVGATEETLMMQETVPGGTPLEDVEASDTPTEPAPTPTPPAVTPK
ncbi:MAG TPA: hypothetical protein VHN77_14745 [Phycisphaerales bacterium]|nr:hypothetical protein [Phycisphaerales bacterium]